MSGNGNLEFGVKVKFDSSEVKSGTAETVSAIEAIGTTAQETGAKGKIGFNALSDASKAFASSTSDDIKKILDRYDPMGAKLAQLKADFAALNSGAMSGNLGANDDTRSDAAYKAITTEIKALEAAAASAGTTSAKAFGEMAAAADKGMFSTVGAKRELIVLGHEAMTGNFSRMPGSFMVLAERIGATGALFNPFTAGIVAIGAAAVVMGEAFNQGHAEMVAMNNAMVMTGNYAGQTRGSMRELAQQISEDGTMTIGVAKDVVTALVGSGQLGSESLKGIAKIAGDYAAATGQDVAKVSSELSRLFADPAKGAEELNNSMHFLSAENQAYIEHLVRIGELEQARKVLLDEFAQKIPKQADDLNDLGRVMNSLADAASSFWEKLTGVGREDTLSKRLADAKHDLENGMAWTNALFDRAGQVAVLQAAMDKQQADADAAAAAAAENQKAAAAKKETDKSSTHQLSVLRDQLTSLNGVPSSDDAEQRKLEINKQIFDLQRQMGAEGAALDKTRIEGQLHLQELAIQMGEQQNDSALKLREITQEEHDQTATSLALQKNLVETIATKQLMSAGMLTAQEKAQLDYKLQALKITEQMIKARGDEKIAEDQAAVEQSRKTAGNMLDKTSLQWAKENDATQRSFYPQPAADASLQASLEKVQLASDKDRLALEQMFNTGKLGAEAYAAMLDDLAGRTDTQKAKVIELANQQATLNSSWEYGATRALEKYGDSAKSVAAETEAAFTRGFSSMEDALVQFAQTGKLNFSNLSNSIISDLIRIEAREATSGVLGFLRTAIGAYLGSSDNVGAGTTVANTETTYSTPVSTPSVQSYELSGGRAAGGPVAAGSLYEVNEQGPELLVSGGRTFLMMGSGGGYVVPSQTGAQGSASASAASPSSIRVSITNTGTQQQVNSAKPQFDVEGLVIHVVTSDIANNGQLAQSMEKQYGLNRAAGAY